MLPITFLAILVVLVLVGGGLITLEIWARKFIRRLRAGFQWLITEQDETPTLDPDGLQKFISNSYDAELGWVRKPNTSGTETSSQRSVQWSTDEIGARRDTLMEGKDINVVAVGDSYTFARQVADEEAWPALLGRLLETRVVNFGVGNYGLDQAILRYRREGRVPGAKIAILGVVPETITRIHSAWKHYSEYGNTFAFKPRFHLSQGVLELWSNVITNSDDFFQYRKFLNVLQEKDYFYRTKFRHDMIRAPYLWHWLGKSRNRHLVALLRERENCRSAGTQQSTGETKPFRSVMERNIRLAGSMYESAEHVALFKSLVSLFAAEARQAGAEPVLVMFPQLLDLECFGANHPYQTVLGSLREHLLIVDAAEALFKNDIGSLYVGDNYGGHYSPFGNAVVAQLIAQRITPILAHE